jgi:hypothetical protein
MLTWLSRDPVRACEWPISTEIILNFTPVICFPQFARRVRKFCESNPVAAGHRKVQELEANARSPAKQIESLTAGLQKVSAQLEAIKPAPQVVNNP